jgi:hypothetical protein
MKAAMMEALVERFPIFGPRGPKLNPEEEERRLAANPVAALAREADDATHKLAEERIINAAHEWHAAGRTEESLRIFRAAISAELDAATGRGLTTGWEQGKREAKKEGPPK